MSVVVIIIPIIVYIGVMIATWAASVKVMDDNSNDENDRPIIFMVAFCFGLLWPVTWIAIITLVFFRLIGIKIW